MFSLAQNYITRGFWGDEAWTSLISQLPYLQMLKTTARDFHPPAYYTVIELWYKIFPATEISTRVVSIIFYLLTGFVVYRLVSFIAPLTSEVRGGKKFWGLLSAIVVLANPIFFSYAFEARNYTMFAFAATGSIYFLLKFSTSSNSKNALGFILFSALGIYTHYYMFFIIAAQVLYLLLFYRKILLKMIGLYAAIGVLYLPWIPLLASQVMSVGQNYWIGPLDNRTHYEAILRILGGEHQTVFRPILFWLSLTLMGIGLAQHIHQKSFEKPPLRQGFEGQAYILIWFWAIVPFVLATLPGLTIGGLRLPFRTVFFWRYLIPAAVPLTIVIVYATQKLPGNLLRVLPAAVIILSLAIDYLALLRYPATFKQVYENEITVQIRPDDKIVTVLPSFAEVLYYRNRFGLVNEIVVLREGIVQFSGKSLLDAYVASGAVAIGDYPTDGYFELRPGPSVQRTE